MKKTIIILRIFATLFLIGVVITIHKTPTGITQSIGVISGAIKISIMNKPDDIYISSALIGFIISLAATILSIRYTQKTGQFKWPLIWAILGIISLTNEITRLFHNHMQILVSVPLIQVIADWMSIRFIKDIKPKEKEPENTQPEADTKSHETEPAPASNQASASA